MNQTNMKFVESSKRDIYFKDIWLNAFLQCGHSIGTKELLYAADNSIQSV